MFNSSDPGSRFSKNIRPKASPCSDILTRSSDMPSIKISGETKSPSLGIQPLANIFLPSSPVIQFSPTSSWCMESKSLTSTPLKIPSSPGLYPFLFSLIKRASLSVGSKSYVVFNLFLISILSCKL